MVTKRRVSTMDKLNPRNERIKRDYFEFLRQADQKSEATVRGIEKALLRLEEHTGWVDFALYKATHGSPSKRLSARLRLARTRPSKAC
jgi:hypothetical protein